MRQTPLHIALNIGQCSRQILRLDKFIRNKSPEKQGSDGIMDQRIFEGLKVLDCASFIAAPAAATVLSDFGADVIKIEPPGSGDPYRNLPNLPGYPISPHNYAWMLESRNKRSLALDLGKSDGQQVLRRLVAETDVFITNFPPGVRKRLGLTYDELAPLNERLIYASFTGYGEKGDEASKLGFDYCVVGAIRTDGRRSERRESPAGSTAHRNGRSPFGHLALCQHLNGTLSTAG